VKPYEPADIRNFAVVGHSGSGKTTVSEAMLFTAGAVSRQGKVADGSSHLDHTPDETKRKAGVYLSLAQFEFGNRKLNLLDTPGYADFCGEAYCGLRAADFGLLVVNAQAGVEPNTEAVCELMDAQGKARLIAVNQMDKEQADFGMCLKELEEVLGKRVGPAFYPIGSGPEFRGLVDVLKGRAVEFGAGRDLKEVPIPDDLRGIVEEARSKLIELAAESDDTLLEKYLETMELTPEETIAGLRRGIAQGTLFPVIPVAAEKGQGIQSLLEMIAELGPSPLDSPGPPLQTAEGEEPRRLTVDPQGPPAALVFKVTTELMAQKFIFFRVYSGSIEGGQDLFNSTKNTGERLGQLYNFLGKDRIEMERLVTGDIGAAAKLKVTEVNHTLCEKAKAVVIQPIDFPYPVHEMAIAPKSKGEEEKTGTAFHKLHEEDPTFLLEVQAELHQTVLRTMGDQHLEVLLDRLKRKFGLEVDVSRPKVPFRETIRGTADVAYRHKKQTGGAGQFADVSIKLEPLPRGGGFEFSDEITGGVIPSRFIPAVEKGIVEVMPEGILAGYPVVDVRVRLYFGGYHDVDSSEMAFKIAGAMAFKNALKEAKPVLLEPILLVEVKVPDEYMGDVMGDLSSRRGKIQGMEPLGRVQVVRAAVPQVELHRYSTTLRSLTQGRARFGARFSHYEEVPREFAEKLIETLKKEREAVA
jgi:elongation factor G